MEHFEYCADLVGIDHVAFGPDTLFDDPVGLHHYFREAPLHRGREPWRAVRRSRVRRPNREPCRGLPQTVRWLVKHDYSDDEIAKTIGGNVMRVLEEAWFR
jgi:membrane dipeptidase